MNIYWRLGTVQVKQEFFCRYRPGVWSITRSISTAKRAATGVSVLGPRI